MRISAVVDINTVSIFFGNADDSPFRLAFEKVRNAKEKFYIVYGGETYFQELRGKGIPRNKQSPVMTVLTNLRNMGKAVQLDESKVNRKEKSIIAKAKSKDLDDAHIIAIAVLGNCQLIFSKDKRAHDFFKDRNLYPKGFRIPLIYSKYTRKEHTNVRKRIRTS